MMIVALLCGMLLALAASVVSAAPGTNLRWNACLGDGGAPNRAFACNTNVGFNSLYGSFEIGADILQANGLEIVIDLASASPTLPAWWSFKNVGSCRQTALSLSVSGALTAVVCYDWAAGQGQATGGISTYTVGGLGPSSARLRLATAVPATALADLFASTEYYGFNLVIRNVKTLGTVAIPACPGCQTVVGLVFNSVKVTTQDAANDRTISGATNGIDSNYATWQGGAATPTHTGTWGAVKSLYR
jgi:hypothetical protein